MLVRISLTLKKLAPAKHFDALYNILENKNDLRVPKIELM